MHEKQWGKGEERGGKIRLFEPYWDFIIKHTTLGGRTRRDNFSDIKESYHWSSNKAAHAAST